MTGRTVSPKASGFVITLALLCWLLDGGPKAWQTANVIAEAQAAIGSTRALQDVRSLILQGTVREGFNGVTGKLINTAYPVEIRIIRPDHFVRIVTTQSMEVRNGYRGAELLNEWIPLRPDINYHVQSRPEDIKHEHARFARLILGMLAEPRTSLRLTAKASGTGFVELVGPDGFRMTLELDSVTRLPSAVRYQDELPFAIPMTPDAAKKGVAPLPKPERADVAWVFDDHRLTDGLRLPYRVRQVSRDVTFFDMRFDRILVNPPLKSSDFKKVR